MVYLAVVYLGVGILSGLMLEAMQTEEKPGFLALWIVFWGPLSLALLVRWIRERNA